MSRHNSSVARIAALLLVPVAMAAGPAQAGLINTYSSTDDVWSAPLGAGRSLLDVRTAYAQTTPSLLMLPMATLAVGLPGNTEIGLWGAYGFTGLGTAQVSGQPSVLNPYFKALLPWTLGGTALGLVAGAQIPTQAGMERNASLEGVATVPLSSSLSLDLNLGVGRTFVAPSTLGHLGAALYYTLPSGMGLIGEAFCYLANTSAPSFGQHVAVTLPVADRVTADAGVAVNQAAGSVSSIVPHLGMTVLW